MTTVGVKGLLHYKLTALCDYWSQSTANN